MLWEVKLLIYGACVIGVLLAIMAGGEEHGK